MIFTVASPLEIMIPISWSLRWTRLALRVSSIHQNQNRAFNLSIFGNWWQPFHKDMNWNSIESMLLAQAYLPCVKGYGQVSWILNGSNCSPYICAKSLDCSLHKCLDRKYRRQCLPNEAKVLEMDLWSVIPIGVHQYTFLSTISN